MFRLAPRAVGSRARFTSVNSLRQYSGLNRIVPGYSSKFEEGNIPYQTWYAYGNDLLIDNKTASIGERIKYITETIDLTQNHRLIVDNTHVFTALMGIVSDVETLRSAGIFELAVHAMNVIKLEPSQKAEIFAQMVENGRACAGAMSTSSIVSTLEELCVLQTQSKLSNPRLMITLFDTVGRRIATLTDTSTMPSAEDANRMIRIHSRGRITSDHLPTLLNYVSRSLGNGTSVHALPPASAVELLYSLIATRQFNQEVLTRVTAVASELDLSALPADALPLRKLKFVEMALRLELPQTYRLLSPSVLEWLSVVREAGYIDQPALNRETACSAQLRKILSSFQLKLRPHMVGPYALRLADPSTRLCVEPLEVEDFVFGQQGAAKLKFWSEAKLRHLELSGWRVLAIDGREWRAIERRVAEEDSTDGRSSYQMKLELVRARLLADGLIDEVPSVHEVEAAAEKAAIANERRKQRILEATQTLGKKTE